MLRLALSRVMFHESSLGKNPARLLEDNSLKPYLRSIILYVEVA
jgi:hypothetical protein